jgi:hypothetical protein
MTSRSEPRITPERYMTHGVVAGALEGHSAHLLCQEAPVVRCAGFVWGREGGVDTARAGSLIGRFRLSLCRRVSRQALG